MNTFNVTILILIDGFLQCPQKVDFWTDGESHNPYFNRWFSAIKSSIKDVMADYQSHNPYFNRWFSAIFNRPI